jgi:hypothetical protein
MCLLSRSFSMVRRLIAVVFAVTVVMAFSVTAQAEFPYHGPSDLFYNYYVPPVGAGSVGAEMYLCPRPTPPLVGHTYITYQPLLPHEFLWCHHRTYVRYNPDAGYTRTRVSWNRWPL